MPTPSKKLKFLAEMSAKEGEGVGSFCFIFESITAHAPGLKQD